jgi:hypothetical protein
MQRASCPHGLTRFLQISHLPPSKETNMTYSTDKNKIGIVLKYLRAFLKLVILVLEILKRFKDV